MSDLAIQVNELSKRYVLGAAAGYSTLRESISQWFRRGTTRAKDPSSAKTEDVWALKGVSFQVGRGEVVGVIGRNGAGKSTLLKLLSRITSPTSGSIEVAGRVGSLLEVGTGFHPELSGRENIYLNGAILGMSRSDIRQRFDEIVAFSEVEKFLDTPVKRYSSGMYMRLAFAVAAHLEPDILIVDEVLAVGDAQFQKKCLGKMDDVARHGRTVLFVSHNMSAVANLCTRAVLLNGGQVRLDGPVNDVVAEYIRLGREATGERIWDDPKSAPGNDKVRIRAVRIINSRETTANVDIDEETRIEIEFWNFSAGARLCSSIHLIDQMGVCVLASANMPSATVERDEWYGQPHPVGLFRTHCMIPANLLNTGMYSISAFVLCDVTKIEATAVEAVTFSAHESGEMRREYTGPWIGVVRPKLAWGTALVGTN